MKYITLVLLLCGLGLLGGCTHELPSATGVKELPALFPDYAGVTIPPNMAPLNFRLQERSNSILLLSRGNRQIRLHSKEGIFDIPLKEWRQLLHEASGDSIQLTLYARQKGEWLRYPPFFVYVAKDSIDSYLAYRRIAPGYRMWNEMGIYQRNLETFDESTFLDNKQTDNSCMNCHSFCMQNPDRMLFHQRSAHAGTYLLIDGEIEKLDLSTHRTVSSLVYPSWHPSGKLVAFSTNETKQDFHLSDPNKIEVFDSKSDVVIYDVEKHQIFTTPLLSDTAYLETFPSFSPDGKRLYFCSAPAKLMPDSFKVMKYNLVSIAFNPVTGTFGNTTDTLHHAARTGRSASFPRVSPDGKYLLYTTSGYGNFSIWHKDADLRLLNLATHQVDSLHQVNSADVESYHSWSSNSRWFVFSSRRMDGLYTRPYICHIDENGVTGKPFLLPQKSPDYYLYSLFSFNIPEFIKGKISTSTYRLIEVSKEGSKK